MLSELEQHQGLDVGVLVVWDRSHEPDWWRVTAYLAGMRHAVNAVLGDWYLDDELTLLVRMASHYAVQQMVHGTLPPPHTERR